jgi:hypothetical protein
MSRLDFGDRFTKYVDKRDYRNVRRYLNTYVFNFQVYNKAVYVSIIKEDDKMFNILTSDIIVMYNLTFDCCYYIMTHKNNYEKRGSEKDYLHYIKRLISLRPEIFNGISPRDMELLEMYKQLSRLKKLYRIRKKTLKQN